MGEYDPSNTDKVSLSKLLVEDATTTGAVNVIASPDVNITTGTDVAVVFGGSLTNPQDVTGSALPSIGGGYDNKILSSIAGTISGGAHHLIDAPSGHGSIGGGASNEVHGAYGTVSGGLSNKSEGDYSSIAGGRNNTSGDAANRLTKTDQFIGGGSQNEALGHQSSILGGFNNQVDASLGSMVGGTGNLIQVSGDTAAIVGGSANMASAAYSAIVGGIGARTTMHGQVSRSGGMFGVVNGEAQASSLTARAITTNATPTELFLDGTAGRLVLPSDTTWTFSIFVVARRTDVDNESAGYKIEGVIDKNVVAASTALVGVPIVTILGEDTAAWDVIVDANTAQGALRLLATGELAKTIRWVANIDLVQVTG